ncbi:MAG: hypothetical protein VKQ33_14775 [Candidatus Sericytochromatia bacterium]|nr:hypothetical protein [Candidatus Sericytochromatia bacterium]
MADAHAHPPQDLNLLFQDGRSLTASRDALDRLVTTGPSIASSQPGATLRGFGPWPSWDANRRQGTLTEPDDDSGLFEPERLFVLREQYAFFAPPDAAGVPTVSLGPIDRAWWTGTEHVVQARQRAGKH